MKSSWLAPNLDAAGRRARLVTGLACLAIVGGLRLWGRPWSIAVAAACGVLTVAGLFMLFEAARGWCLLRACGIRTRI